MLREIGVETGGSNVQFAVNPDDGRLVVIEMNPRVSRSSALASKATGFPIAKVAAKLAVGYTLDELENDITGGATPASFEPTIDYVVTKIPRFAFEKFAGADPTLTTSMKSVGEVMAIGRTFAESLQKALRSMETGLTGLDDIELEGLGQGDDKNVIRAALPPADTRPHPEGRPGAAPRRRSRTGSRVLPRSIPGSLPACRRSSTLEARVTAHGLPREADNVPQPEGSRASPMPASRKLAGSTPRPRSPPGATRSACTRSSSASTRARPSSPRPRPTCTRPTSAALPANPPAKPSRPTAKRSSFSAAVRTASARASSSTIAAATPASR